MFQTKAIKTLMLVAGLFFIAGCGMQSIPRAKNQTEADLAEITNQYKRRSDLVPSLVETVKGYAKHESGTLQAVTDARAKATAITIDPSKATPAQIAEYQKAQGQLSTALGRLLVASENYPNLKADQQFIGLQAQLEGTENRIARARNVYIGSVREFNNLVTTPPTSWTNSILYHHEKLPQWDVAADEKQKIEKAPEVKF